MRNMDCVLHTVYTYIILSLIQVTDSMTNLFLKENTNDLPWCICFFVGHPLFHMLIMFFTLNLPPSLLCQLSLYPVYWFWYHEKHGLYCILYIHMSYYHSSRWQIPLLIYFWKKTWMICHDTSVRLLDTLCFICSIFFSLLTSHHCCIHGCVQFGVIPFGNNMLCQRKQPSFLCLGL